MKITDFKPKDQIIQIVDSLGNLPLKKGSHGYSDKLKDQTILKSAERNAANYTEKSKKRPGLAIATVVLAANRSYENMVASRVKLMEASEISTVEEITKFINSVAEDEFYNLWNTKDHKKYTTLKSILARFQPMLKDCDSALSEFESIKKWGEKVNIANLKSDPIGQVKNVGIATLQHLRMTFGVSTLKPDQRVKEVIKYEFGVKSVSDVNAILLMEQIADITGKDILLLDQIFVKYGSGYYNRTSTTIKIKEVARRLKKAKVSDEIISEATDLSLEQVKKL